MRGPLDVMKIRNAYEDARYKGKPGINASNLTNSPFGGTYGKEVRCSSVKNPHGIHQGWDLYAPLGTRALAITSGRVVVCQTTPGVGPTGVFVVFRQATVL